MTGKIKMDAIRKIKMIQITESFLYSMLFSSINSDGSLLFYKFVYGNSKGNKLTFVGEFKTLKVNESARFPADYVGCREKIRFKI